MKLIGAGHWTGFGGDLPEVEIDLPDAVAEKVAEYSQMTASERAFIHNLLHAVKPKKILELGVSSGAGSIVIANAIKERPECEFFTFDISPHYTLDIKRNRPQDQQRPSGFLVSEVMPELAGRITNIRDRAGIFPYLDQIGPDIDFCVMDAAHTLPGEVLDLILILPYLSPDCMVVLHDINLRLDYSFSSRVAVPVHNAVIACRLLFNAVSAAEKIIPKKMERAFANIGAFKVSPQTRDNIADVFNTLLLEWQFIPSEIFLTQARAHIEKYYAPDLLSVFDMAVNDNKGWHQHKAGKAG